MESNQFQACWQINSWHLLPGKSLIPGSKLGRETNARKGRLNAVGMSFGHEINLNHLVNFKFQTMPIHFGATKPFFLRRNPWVTTCIALIFVSCFHSFLQYYPLLLGVSDYSFLIHKELFTLI